jgi:hypothetical protein
VRIAYGNRVRELLRRTPEQTSAGSRSLLLGRSSEALVFVVVAVSVFWTTATVAPMVHPGRMLLLRSPGIVETVLDESDGQLVGD